MVETRSFRPETAGVAENLTPCRVEKQPDAIVHRSASRTREAEAGAWQGEGVSDAFDHMRSRALIALMLGAVGLPLSGCIGQAIQAVTAPQGVAADALTGAAGTALGKASTAGAPVAEVLDAGQSIQDLSNIANGSSTSNGPEILRLQQAISEARAMTPKAPKRPASAFADASRDREWDSRLWFDEQTEPAALRRMRLPSTQEVDILGKKPKAKGDRLALGDRQDGLSTGARSAPQLRPEIPYVDIQPIRLDR